MNDKINVDGYNLISPERASKVFGLNVETVKRKLRSGAWPHYKLGGKSLMLDAAEVLKHAHQAGGK